MEIQVKVGFDQEALKFLSAMVLTLGGKLLGGVSEEREAAATEGLRGMAGLNDSAPKKEETKKEEAKKEEPKKEETKKEEAKPVGTLDELNKAAMDVKTRHGGDITKIKELLASYKVKKISEIPEDKRAEALAKLEAM